MEAEARAHTTRPPFPLLQVGTGRPDSGVVRHVVVRREELHLGLTAVNNIHYIVDSDRRLRDVGRQNYLWEKPI